MLAGFPPVPAASLLCRCQTHLYDQEALRHHYYGRIVKGIQGRGFAPDRVEVSIIYDFMDQAKTACPHFKKERIPKNAEGGNQRVFRIMGVKVRPFEVGSARKLYLGT